MDAARYNAAGLSSPSPGGGITWMQNPPTRTIPRVVTYPASRSSCYREMLIMGLGFMADHADPSTIDALFEQLFEAYRQPILNYLYRLLGDGPQAEDVCQDVFVKAYRALPRLPDDANHRAWLYRIASNAAIDRHRRRKILQWLPLRDRDAANGGVGTRDGPETHVSERSAVQEALGALPLNYRQPLVLFSVQGYSIREISEMLGMSEGAVKTRLCRAREKFRVAYGKENGDAL